MLKARDVNFIHGFGYINESWQMLQQIWEKIIL